jgi:regulator of cell morphogenesis and NO signaling
MTMKVESNLTEKSTLSVADLAIENPNAIQIFKKYNIDFCCGGKKKLIDVCNNLGLNVDQVLKEIDVVQDKTSEEHLRFNSWSPAFLADYIVANHHSYVKAAIPEILRLLTKTAAAHGEDDVELVTIQEKFNLLSEELLNHLEKEEQVLFPMIRNLNEALPDYVLSRKEIIHGPLNVMEAEHEVAGELIKSIRLLSNNYTPPVHACPTYIITYKKLKEFDDDLMKHIHLENNILFEKITDGSR